MGYPFKTAFKPATLFIAAILAQGVAMQSLQAARTPKTIEQKFAEITEEQRALYNIVHTEWRGTHGFIIGCHSCEGAIYDTTNGALLNPASLVQIPTTWTMRVPSGWNGKVVILVPPGNLDPAVAYVNLIFLATILNNQYAVAIMNHPSPSYPGFPYADFSDPPYSPREYRREYRVTSRILNRLTRDIFGRPQAVYGLSTSRGTSLGLGMLLDLPNSPFDGFLVAQGGDGYEGSMGGFQEAYESTPNRMPLTGIPPLQTTAAQKVERLLFFLGTVDPAYNAYVRAGATPDEQLARGLAYDISAQSRKIQRDWDSIAMGVDLQRPTIVLQGLRERTVPLSSPLGFMKGVEESGQADYLRTYFIKDMGHVAANDPPGVPNSFFVEGLAKLDAWVQNGTEPGPLNTSPFTPSEQPSCTELGLDSVDCFCAALEDGVGGYCSEDPAVACVTASPAKAFYVPVPPLFTPIPDDTCVGLGKGTCVAELPEECGQ